MKILILLILTLFYQQSLACSCAAIPLLERITESDFIATAKILNLSPDKQNTYLADIEIDIIDLYKGDTTPYLKIRYGSGSACGIKPPIDSSWLIFADKNIDGNLKFGLCSQSRQLDKKFNSYVDSKDEDFYNKATDIKLQILEYLHNENIHPSNEFGLSPSFSRECLKKLNEFEITTDQFALFELTIDKDLNINVIESLKEFESTNLQEETLNCMNKNLKAYQKRKELIIPSYTKIIIGQFYHPSAYGEQGYIDQYSF